MKRIVLIITLLVPMFLKAQTPWDLYDFSSVIYQGTAKSAAMGNAIGAVGQDFSAIAINPAGLGMFRKASFVFTPEFYVSSTNSEYQGNNRKDRAFKLPVNNVGLTWTNDINDGTLKTVSFAIGMNRTNNYTYNSYVNGDNPHTSLVNAYINELNSNNIFSSSELYNFSPNTIYPLYYTWVFDTIGPNEITHSLVPSGGLNQQRGVVKRGRSHEITVASGLNFNDKWFLGFSINIPHFNRDMTTEYKEKNLSSGFFKSWSQNEYMMSVGWGINAKIGVIAFPMKWLRLGAAFHTPTIYNIDESWYTKTYSKFNGQSFSYPSETGTYSYTLVTPYRANASAAFIFGNFGMITADYELTDYTVMSASANDFNFDNVNDYIDDTFSITSNFRIGTEWRYQNLSFRGGYALYGGPYGLGDSRMRTNAFSCGLGYTFLGFSIDAAYVFSQRTNEYQLYSNYSLYPAYYTDGGNQVVDDTNVKETTNMHQLVVSLRFRLD